MSQSTIVKLKNHTYIQVWFQEVLGKYQVFLPVDDGLLLEVTQKDVFLGILCAHPHHLNIADAEEILQNTKYNLLCGPAKRDIEKFEEMFPQLVS